MQNRYHQYPACKKMKVEAESRAEKEKLDERKAAAQVIFDAIIVDEPAVSKSFVLKTVKEAAILVLATEPVAATFEK